MSGVAAMAILFGVLILALLGYFAFMWTKEKGRSDEQGGDSARLHTDTDGGTPSGDDARGV